MMVSGVLRRIALAVAVGCAAALTLPGADAVAEPPPEPAPSISSDDGSGDTLVNTLTLQLSPPRGEPGTSFTATVTKTGIDRRCTVLALSWFYETKFASLDLSTNTAGATFTVPDSAAGNHPVTASCLGATPGTADFTVLEPTPDPALTLDPTAGPPGSPVLATVTDCKDAGSLSWDGDAVLEGPDGPFTVPQDAPVGAHTVSVSCDSVPESTTFTVVPPAPPTLELNRSDGPPGTEITASGTGFACTGTEVRLAWDDGTAVTTTSGSFTQRVTSPSSARDHRITASCTDNPEIADTASFTVTQAPVSTPVTTAPTVDPTESSPVTETTTAATVSDERTTEPPVVPPLPPPPGVPLWVIALLVVAVLLAAAGYRNWRKQQVFRVHAVARPGGPPMLTLHEAPGESTHAIRVRVDAGTAQHTIDRGDR